MTARYLAFEEAVHLHRQLMLEEGQSAVLVAAEKLESALQRPRAEAFGEEFYPALAERLRPSCKELS